MRRKCNNHKKNAHSIKYRDQSVISTVPTTQIIQCITTVNEYIHGRNKE